MRVKFTVIGSAGANDSGDERYNRAILSSGVPIVEINRLSLEPITMPEFPDPTPITHHVRLVDRTTTLHVEAAT